MESHGKVENKRRGTFLALTVYLAHFVIGVVVAETLIHSSYSDHPLTLAVVPDFVVFLHVAAGTLFLIAEEIALTRYFVLIQLEPSLEIVLYLRTSALIYFCHLHRLLYLRLVQEG